MEIFNFIAGCASIIALLISLFALKKVKEIDNSIKITQKMQNTGDGSINKQAGRDIHEK